MVALSSCHGNDSHDPDKNKKRAVENEIESHAPAADYTIINVRFGPTKNPVHPVPPKRYVEIPMASLISTTPGIVAKQPITDTCALTGKPSTGQVVFTCANESAKFQTIFLCKNHHSSSTAFFSYVYIDGMNDGINYEFWCSTHTTF